MQTIVSVSGSHTKGGTRIEVVKVDCKKSLLYYNFKISLIANVIFIDNSFMPRIQVSKKIVVFSMII